jgi:hypothetical protein
MLIMLQVFASGFFGAVFVFVLDLAAIIHDGVRV